MIAYSPNIKFLGITVTENLKWHAHIDVLCKSLNSLSCTFSVSCYVWYYILVNR